MHLARETLAFRFLGVDQHLDTGQRTLRACGGRGGRGGWARVEARPLQAGLETLEVRLLALQLFQLPAHDKKTLLRVERRVIRVANILKRHLVKLVLYLL